MFGSRVLTSRCKLMGSANGKSIYVFANGAGPVPFDCPNVCPIRAGGFTRRLDVHREASQNDHFVPLRDEFLWREFDDFLHFAQPAEELPDLLAPFPGSGKRYICHLRQHPQNIFS